MLSDRDYMRSPGYRAPWSLTAKLLVALVAVYAVQCVNWVYAGTAFERWLGLTTLALRRGYVWQFLTYQFLHGGMLHLVFNLIGFWWLGRFVESALGWRRFLLVWLGSGAVGGVFQAALMWAFPGRFGAITYGASAGVSGLLAVFAWLEGPSEVRWNFVIPMSARTLFWLTGGVSLFFTIVPADPGTAHAAHLGGLVAGWAFVRLGWHRDFVELPWVAWWHERARRRPARSARDPLADRDRDRDGVLVPAPGPLAGRPRTGPAPRARSTADAEFIAREIDPILEKIGAHGFQSLTDHEKQLLASAKRKLS